MATEIKQKSVHIYALQIVWIEELWNRKIDETVFARIRPCVIIHYSKGDSNQLPCIAVDELGGSMNDVLIDFMKMSWKFNTFVISTPIKFVFFIIPRENQVFHYCFWWFFACHVVWVSSHFHKLMKNRTR